MKLNHLLTKRIILLLFVILLSSSVLAEKILFIGDSHSVGTYGKEINKLLSKDNTVRHYAVCGASPSYWRNEQRSSCASGKYLYIHENGIEKTDLEKTPKLADLISDFQPTVVIITMGGNPAGKTPANYDESVASLVKVITNNNIKCYWVGPPGKTDSGEAALRNERYQAIIVGVSNNCILIDSRDKVKLNKDEIHFSDNTRPTQWAQKVYEEISPGLKYGIMGDIYATIKKGSASATPTISSTPPSPSFPSPTFQPTSTTKIFQPLCLNQQQCQEIDEAWASHISTYVNPDFGDKVFAVPGGWVPYTTLYAEPKSAQATADIYVPQGSLDKSKSMKQTYDTYKSIIDTTASTNNIDKSLILAVIQKESSGNSKAVSPCGAGGLMQIVGTTAAGRGLKLQFNNIDASINQKLKTANDASAYKKILNDNNLWQPCPSCNPEKLNAKYTPCNSCHKEYCDYNNDERFIPEKTIPAGAKLLASLIASKGNEDLALQAYYGGDSADLYAKSVLSLKQQAEIIVK